MNAYPLPAHTYRSMAKDWAAYADNVRSGEYGWITQPDRMRAIRNAQRNTQVYTQIADEMEAQVTA